MNCKPFLRSSCPTKADSLGDCNNNHSDWGIVLAHGGGVFVEMSESMRNVGVKIKFPPVDSRMYIQWAAGNQNMTAKNMTAVSSERIVSDYFDLPDSVLTAKSIIIFNPNLDLLWDDSHTLYAT